MDNKKKEESIINKIKNLLKKTKEAGCSDAESQSALAKAQELIVKYRIDESKLKDISKVEDIVESTVCDVINYTCDDSSFIKIANIIAKNFRCRIYYIKSHSRYDHRAHRYYQTSRKASRYPVFVGRESDVNLAVIAFLYAYDSAWYGCRKYARENDLKVTKIRWSYYEGYSVGLDKAFNSKILEHKEDSDSTVSNELQISQYELMLVPDAEVDIFVESLGLGSFTPKRGMSKSCDYEAYSEGVAQGEKFNSTVSENSIGEVRY